MDVHVTSSSLQPCLIEIPAEREASNETAEQGLKHRGSIADLWFLRAEEPTVVCSVASGNLLSRLFVSSGILVSPKHAQVRSPAREAPWRPDVLAEVLATRKILSKIDCRKRRLSERAIILGVVLLAVQSTTTVRSLAWLVQIGESPERLTDFPGSFDTLEGRAKARVKRQLVFQSIQPRGSHYWQQLAGKLDHVTAKSARVRQGEEVLEAREGNNTTADKHPATQGLVDLAREVLRKSPDFQGDEESDTSTEDFIMVDTGDHGAVQPVPEKQVESPTARFTAVNGREQHGHAPSPSMNGDRSTGKKAPEERLNGQPRITPPGQEKLTITTTTTATTNREDWSNTTNGDHHSNVHEVQNYQPQTTNYPDGESSHKRKRSGSVEINSSSATSYHSHALPSSTKQTPTTATSESDPNREESRGPQQSESRDPYTPAVSYRPYIASAEESRDPAQRDIWHNRQYPPHVSDEHLGEVLQRASQNIDAQNEYNRASPGDEDRSAGPYSQYAGERRDMITQSELKKRKRNFSNRTKTGCMTCRRRKKKCDETRPECNNCLRGGFVCSGYQQRGQWPKTEQKQASVPLKSKNEYEVPAPYNQSSPYGPQLAPPRREPLPGYRGQALRVDPHHGRPVGMEDDQPSASTIPSASVTSPEVNRLSAISYQTPTPTSASTSAYSKNEYQRLGPLHDLSRQDIRHDPDSGTPQSAQSTTLPQILHPQMHAESPHSNVQVAAQLALSHVNSANRPRSQKEEMLAGRHYYPFDKELVLERERCNGACWRFNSSTNPNNGVSPEERARLFRDILQPREHVLSPTLASPITPIGRVGENVVVEAPFTCDYGYNISIGQDVAIGKNCTILDTCEVRIGDRCNIGPNVNIYTATLPVDPKRRLGSRGPSLGRKITIDSDCWIGGGVTILPGRTIGKGSTVGAGSIVTRDVPPYTVVCGRGAYDTTVSKFPGPRPNAKFMAALTMATTGSTTSSMTSTSHTLTAFPPSSAASAFPIQISKNSSPMSDLLAALTPANRHVFIQPPKSLPNSSLEFAKATLDSFAAQLSEEQAIRQKEERKKRKRGDRDGADGEILKIRKIHTEGFEVEQVWEQTRRVIDALRGDAEKALEELSDVDDEDDEEQVSDDGGARLQEFDEDGFEVGSDDEEPLEGSMEDSQEENEDEELLADEDNEEDDDAEPDAEDFEDQDDYEDEDGDDLKPADTFVEDPHGLNDGFFSIDDFNKQTEFLERQDAAGDPFTGEASDEEDIDWDDDPLTIVSKPLSSKRRAASMDIENDDMDNEDDEDEGGPTFGNVDLNAPEGESGDEDEEGSDIDGDQNDVIDNTNDIKYQDFFEPPPRKTSKKELQAKYVARKARAQKLDQDGDEKAEMERAMADVKRDLFDDESDLEDSEDALSEVDPADPKSRKSAHERRQAKLAEEIRRLEATSVAKREWTLSGEAKAADRPQNSLLEEDLDFERTGKPVPVITAEVSESIEELIKRRILAQEFDEVIRRRPDASDIPSSTRRGLFELDDTKPKQSLAEIYEEEHVKNTNPDTYVSQADEKLRKDEKEIEQLWKEVSAKLDALSSWHYKPKPAAPNLTVVADVATVSIEDAQPSTASGMNGLESMLAPQEIYKAGQAKSAIEKGEIVPKSGAPVARQEMTREEKLRRRRREKERIKKQGGLDTKKGTLSRKGQERKDAIGELKKGGVRVIDRKGEIRDIDGNKVQAARAASGAGGFKL
ncbi:hypothetical protein B7463_g6668, partial [Scytalidium lignicola]